MLEHCYNNAGTSIEFSVAKVTLHSQMSVRLSVSPSEIKTPQPLIIKPICHYAYLLISQIPISHHANQPPCPLNQPLCQLAIIPNPISHHHAYWLLYLSGIYYLPCFCDF